MRNRKGALGIMGSAPILRAVTNMSLRRALALDRTPFTYNPAALGDWSRDRTPVRRSPKRVLDDMARLKSVFEHGKSRIHSHRLTTEEIQREIGLRQSEKTPGEAAKVVRLPRRDASIKAAVSN